MVLESHLIVQLKLKCEYVEMLTHLKTVYKINCKNANHNNKNFAERHIRPLYVNFGGVEIFGEIFGSIFSSIFGSIFYSKFGKLFGSIFASIFR